MNEGIEHFGIRTFGIGVGPWGTTEPHGTTGPVIFSDPAQGKNSIYDRCYDVKELEDIGRLYMLRCC